MKSIGITLLILSFTATISYAQAEMEKIYLLVDTIHMVPENKFVEIGQEGSLIYYQFYCNCVSPYERNLTFSYNVLKNQTTILKGKPNFKFMSWREFQDLVTKLGYNLDLKYEVYISELLPHRKYRTNQVFMAKFSHSIVQ